MRRTVLKDIADKVGCSIAVVSYVVNNSAGNISCSPELREHILSVAEELEYTQHYASRALKKQRSYNIGIYIPEYTVFDAAFNREREIISGAESVCDKSSYELVVIMDDNDSPDIKCNLKFNSHRIDGLIALHANNNSGWIERLAASDKNIVAVNYYGSAGVDVVNFDQVEASRLAVLELAKFSHRRIGCIGSPGNMSGEDSALRLEGFKKAFTEIGLHIDPSMIFMPDGNLDLHQSAANIASRIMAMPPEQRPTAIIGFSETSLLLVLNELVLNGIRMPEDISMIGIDDSPLCQFFSPELSCVKQPFRKLGMFAAERAIKIAEERFENRLRKKEHEHTARIVEPELVLRDSIAAAGK
ncbi:MAG: LacI family transcriptional regulator [Lentisphaerae bacterium]|jgi:DNA-binding LacI/PurR family transcriptional regulator|nr:LacI family transcriptional regulator [Lentisphaerota bacterium]